MVRLPASPLILTRAVARFGRHTRYRTTTHGAEHEEGGALEDGDAD